MVMRLLFKYQCNLLINISVRFSISFLCLISVVITVQLLWINLFSIPQ